ncbi:hypothetical protein sscle_07g058640 [Sclerotinia sclerotiorum 1980 UF-70]|nr:hypothetical protein sscle_07g058640 [Sclerotinia sclerotiorum 1980 UF-70]
MIPDGLPTNALLRAPVLTATKMSELPKLATAGHHAQFQGLSVREFVGTKNGTNFVNIEAESNSKHGTWFNRQTFQQLLVRLDDVEKLSSLITRQAGTC